MKVLALAASNSSTSINKQLAVYAAGLVPNAEVEVLDLNDFEMPIFSEDKEKELGQPELAQRFFQKLGDADVIVISYAEHNGSYSAAFKNVFDWTSRIDMKVYQGKPVIMLATSPGPGGASSVLAAATGSAPYFAAEVKGSLSIPSFYDNFDMEKGELKNEALAEKLKAIITEL
ncbi:MULTISPECIES: NADPH-dependent FMN reductase [Aliivibrio]|uniref:NADPH-dependent FMN reductase n=2 Tax=Aliivibrio logei TaxID=688 RepID=A0A1B9P4E1_ALILO|nr:MULTISPECIES: NAD(P)H-dependent oxidoreductase [Aliivibrio]MBB1314229.1 NAD(P)H-dependent oxidoreductase [Aliivibrio sp. SR45-2]OCH23342.1 NADPH-dependent FMN reductase [Aliivibrio logei]OEF11799.1 NADPH-dependent FMN reductase [Aliivibrio logei 5S-186]